jgi:hypothetical protein
VSVQAVPAHQNRETMGDHAQPLAFLAAVEVLALLAAATLAMYVATVVLD